MNRCLIGSLLMCFLVFGLIEVSADRLPATAAPHAGEEAFPEERDEQTCRTHGSKRAHARRNKPDRLRVKQNLIGLDSDRSFELSRQTRTPFDLYSFRQILRI
jgi:hypothetical protein